MSSLVERLKKAWVNEKFCPEILTFESDLFAELYRRLEKQACRFSFVVFHRKITKDTLIKKKYLQELAAFTEEATSYAFIQMDTDRVEFMMKAYLRIRLQKVTHCFDLQ